MDKSTDFRAGLPGFETLLHHIAERSWASYVLTSLGFSFLICKKDKIIASASELVNKLIFTKHSEQCAACSKLY